MWASKNALCASDKHQTFRRWARDIVLSLSIVFLVNGCYATTCGNKKCEQGETVGGCPVDCAALKADAGKFIFVSKLGTAPRGVQVGDDTLVVGYVQNEVEKSVLRVVRYDSKTYQVIDRSDVVERPGRAGYNLGNPTPFQTRTGRLIVGYRDHLPADAHSRYRLRVAFSDDKGKTWVTQKNESVGAIAQSDEGLWEPNFYYDKQGVLRVVYAREEVNTECSSQKGSKQNIVMKASYDDGLTWQDERVIAGEGSSRDGVPAISTLADGSYLLVFESWRKAGCGDSIPALVVRSMQSRDGVNWEKRRIVYQPTSSREGSRKAFDYPRASWPSVATLPDGRVLVAFTTDEEFPNRYGRYGKDEDKQMNVRLLMSKGGASFNSLEWDYLSITQVTPLDDAKAPNARYASLAINKTKERAILFMGLPPRVLQIDMGP